MVNSEIEIKLKAIDEASSVVAAASNRISDSCKQVTDSQKDLSAAVGESTRQNEVSLRSFTTGVSGAATAAFSFYGAYDRVNNAELSLDRSNLLVKSSTKAVEDAQRRLSNAISENGASSQEAKSAQEALSIAQDRLTLANERAEQAQENVNKAILSGALQVIPTSITMVDNLSKAWKNFPDIGGVIDKVSGSVDGLSGKLQGLNSIKFTQLIGALSAIAVVAISVKGAVDQVNSSKETYKIEHGENAQMPWYEQVGNAIVGFGSAPAKMVLTPILEQFGLKDPTPFQQAVLNKFMKHELTESQVKQALASGVIPAMALGGIVDSATLALVGEAGPEIVMPLSKYETERKEAATQLNVPNVFHIQVTQQFYGDINSPEYVDLAAEKTIEKLDEKLAHWR